MKKAYISGGITNVPNYRELFEAAEIYLVGVGFFAVNPVSIGDEIIFPENCIEHEKYSLYMRHDLKALLNCDIIFMLKNWKQSKGALFEKDTAEICGMEIIYEI